MELINCGRCGRLQVQKPDTLCKECQQVYIAESHLVKDYVKNNPGVTLMDVVKHTGLPLRWIKEMLK
ncbi:hypothetical protein B1A99_08390 [Cohnella sp. CIP 111063]|uniref:hypothetical protein n=1 Tax=unclassified Cohnella TaxID=2636738 RepID=UPI000B8C01E8|nr:MULTISPECIES: hypothetical protein [unclassified Cohnella]OXS60432.1 hypothetical protein B1A99_08390 [Cohnella sp. CIP 111063]PRX73135.1 hypothetical protein B0G52_104235 [Cohnella sp. SGD-V74]